MQRRLMVGSAAALVAVLAACSQQPTEVAPTNTGAPEATDDLVIACTVQEDWCQEITRVFGESTGVATNYVHMATGEAVARIVAGGPNPEFDVLFGGPSDSYAASKDSGLLEPYTSDAIEQIPERFRDPDNYWTGVYTGALGFCSNQDVLDELGLGVPTSWADLLDPGFQNQIGMAHPATSGTAYTILWTQVVLADGDEDAAVQYMRSLDPNVLQYTRSGGASGPMAGRGEIATALIFSHDCVKYAEEGMDALVTSFPSEGTGVEVGGAALLVNAANRANGEAFLDFLASPAGQEIGPTVGSYQLPTHPDAEVSDKAVRLDDLVLVDYDTAAAGAAQAHLLERFEAEVAGEPAE